MPPCTVVERLPDAETYNRLRGSVGWATYEADTIEHCLAQSRYCVCAALGDGEIIGMARVVGDGGLVCYIQDVIVLPQWQRRGIGRAMMDKVMAFVDEHAAPGAVIGLMAALGKEAFYRRYGFTVRPDARFGPGMHLRR